MAKWSKKRRAVTRMVAIVTLVFSLCWLPITLYIISANVFDQKTAFLYYFKIIANSFAYLNSAVNPIIYAFLNRSFRNNCGSIFSKPACFQVCQKRQQRTELLASSQRHRHHLQAGVQPKKQDTEVVTGNRHPLTTHHENSDDFSDAEFEGANADGLSQVTIKQMIRPSVLSKEQYATLLLSLEAGGRDAITTSL